MPAPIITSQTCPRCRQPASASPCPACGCRFAAEVHDTRRIERTGPTTPGGYRVLGPVARGGMGVVFHGLRVSDGQRVVLKAPRRLDEEHRRRFTTEARALATCRHPYVVRLLDIDCTPGGVPLLVLEELPGATLRRALDRGPLNLQAVAALARDLGRALAHCHGRGVIHRDIKPENIILTRDRAVLIDFGLARVDAVTSPNADPPRLTPVMALLGTPPYAAPEQLMDPHAAGPPADIFALGRVLRECLDEAGCWNRATTGERDRWLHFLDACCADRPERRPDGLAIAAFGQTPTPTPLPPTVATVRATGPDRRWWLGIGLAASTLLGLAGWWHLSGGGIGRERLLSGTIAPQAEGDLVVELGSGVKAEIRPLDGTRIRQVGSGPWNAEVLSVEADSDGLARLRVRDADGTWAVRVRTRW